MPQFFCSWKGGDGNVRHQRGAVEAISARAAWESDYRYIFDDLEHPKAFRFADEDWRALDAEPSLHVYHGAERIATIRDGRTMSDTLRELLL